MFTKLGRDEVLMHGPALVVRLLGKPRPGMDPEWVKNRSMRGPFSKGLLLQIGRLQLQSECIAMMIRSV